jgi:hypothetical protein
MLGMLKNLATTLAAGQVCNIMELEKNFVIPDKRT